MLGDCEEGGLSEQLFILTLLVAHTKVFGRL